MDFNWSTAGLQKLENLTNKEILYLFFWIINRNKDFSQTNRALDYYKHEIWNLSLQFKAFCTATPRMPVSIATQPVPFPSALILQIIQLTFGSKSILSFLLNCLICVKIILFTFKFVSLFSFLFLLHRLIAFFFF